MPHPPDPGDGTRTPAPLALLLGGAGAVVLVVVLLAVLLPSSGSSGSSGSPGKQEGDSPYDSYEPTGTLAFPARSKGAAGIAFSPDGKTLATGDDDGKVRLWDVAARKVRTGFTNRDPADNISRVNSVAFSPDGRLLATGGATGTTGLWNVADRRQLYFLHMGGESVEFAPEGEALLALGSRTGSVYLWDPAERSDDIVAYFDHESPVSGVAFSPDGRTLASASDDSGSNRTPENSVRLWDVAGRDPEPYGQGDPRAALDHRFPVLSVAFSSDGKTLATGDGDGVVRLWDTADGRRKATLRNDYLTSVVDLAFSPDGRTLATTTALGGGVLLWNVADGKPRALLETGEDEGKGVVEDVTFSPDGKLIAGNDRKDRAVRLWKAPR